MNHTMDTHWKGCPSLLYLLCDTYFPPWKTKAPFAPKHKNFFASSSLVSLPHFISRHYKFNKIIITQPIHNSFHLKSNRNLNPRLNHICMNTNPWTIIYRGNLITWDYYEPSNLDGLLDLGMHEFSKSLATSVRPMHWGVIWDIQTLEELIQGLIFQHWMTMRQNMKQRSFIWTIFWFPSPASLFICAKIDFEPLCIYNL